MKKILATVIVLMLLVGCCLIAAFPTSAIEIDYDNFDIYDNEITEYMGNDEEVIFPSVDADGDPVLRVGNKCCKGNTDMVHAYFCEGIELIGDDAFVNCYRLSTVSLPYSLTSMRSCNTFQRTSITSIVFPGQLEMIPCCVVQNANATESGFEDRYMLTDVVISYGVKGIKIGAFFYDGDNPLIFPSTVNYINGAFDQYRKKDLDVYVLNPDCELGTMLKPAALFKPNTNSNGQDNTYKYDTEAPIVLPWKMPNKNPVVNYYGLAGSTLQEHVEKWQGVFPDAAPYMQFHAIDQATANAKDQWCKDNGVIKPTKWTMEFVNGAKNIEEAEKIAGDGTHTDDEDEEYEEEEAEETNADGTKKTTKKKTTKADGTTVEEADGEDSGADQLVKIILIAVGALGGVIVLAIAVVLIIVLTKKNKKKKKKAVAEEVEAEPVIDEAGVEEVSEETPAENE